MLKTQPGTSLVRPETTITDTGGGWTVSYKSGAYDDYDYNGSLLGRTDTNGNTVSYSWSGGLLDSITDIFGHTIFFAYTAGLVSSITDWAGRVTSLEHTSGRLTKITRPDPDGAGPLAAPVRLFEHDPATGLPVGETDPLGNSRRYSYDFAGRVSTITTPRGGTINVDPVVVQGLPNRAAGQGTQANPATLISAADAVGSRTGPTGSVTRVETDYRNFSTREIDALGRETIIQRNEAGGPETVIRPDPDGGGPLGEQTFTIRTDAGVRRGRRRLRRPAEV